MPANSWIESVKTKVGKKYRVRYRDETGKKRAIKPLCNTYATALTVSDEVDRKIQNKAFGLLDERKDIQSLYEEYLKYPLRSKRDSTVRHIQDHLKNFLASYGSKKLIELKTADIWDHVNGLKEKTYSRSEEGIKKKYTPGGINIKLVALRALLSYAVKRGYLRSNPAAGVPLLETEEVGRMLSPEEAKILLDKGCEHNLELAKILLIFLNTGMRFGEVVSLLRHAPGVHLEPNGILIERKSSKTRKQKFIPVHKDLEPIIGEVRNGKFKEWSKWRLQRAFRRAVDRSNFGRVRLHDLRHTAASWLLRYSGWSLEEVAKLLGHATIYTTQRYAHFERNLMKEKMDREPSVLGAKSWAKR